ncbi:tryptophan 2,3-dioxygenase [Amanita rubescens]|nr:tryptophan 2,3-dioxygenase [Amanita rubescens]
MALDPAHFLSPRPATSTLAAHDFDIDNRTGFMPPHPPIHRLPPQWEIWESLLDRAQSNHIQPGDKPDLSEKSKADSENWRREVRAMPILETKPLAGDEEVLRRAHHVLAWILHFYVHSIPAEEEGDGKTVVLELPPVLTYSDTVLYNWDFEDQDPIGALDDQIPTPTTPLKSLTLFTSTPTEREFFLVCARVELRGVRALDLMRATMDELFIGDDIASRRISGYLEKLTRVVEGMTSELKGLKSRGCDPDVFYREVRPWIRGADSDVGAKKWVFEGLDLEEEDGGGEPMWNPVELSGPSAGQSSIVHALDVFLGVDKLTHSVGSFQSTESTEDTVAKTSFLTRMQQYMPRRHRSFLQHLAANPRPLREFVVNAEPGELVEAYNGAVKALKEFRDAHMIIVALYIVGPARRAQREAERSRLVGTGGTDMVRFLKTVRDETKSALLID